MNLPADHSTDRRSTAGALSGTIGLRGALGATKGKKSLEVPVPSFVLDELSKMCSDKSMDALVFPRAATAHTCLGQSRTAGGSTLRSTRTKNTRMKKASQLRKCSGSCGGGGGI